jgi:hypothetical protein
MLLKLKPLRNFNKEHTGRKYWQKNLLGKVLIFTIYEQQSQFSKTKISL